MMIRVLFILPYLHSGGTERVILTYMNALDRTKYTPRLLLINHDVEAWEGTLAGLDVTWALENGEHFLRHPVRLVRNLMRQGQWADMIVGGMELTSTYLAVLAGALASKPVLGWVHMDMQYFQPAHRMAHSVVSRYIYPKLNSILAVSEGVARSVSYAVPKAAARVQVLYNPVDVDDLIQASNAVAELLDHPAVVAVGRLEHQKGYDILIQAHAQLIHQGIHHRLVIIGKGSRLTALKQLAISLGVEASVSFSGFLENPYPLMKQADVFVLSSRYEGFGMVVLEALSLGLPVVSTRCPSGPEEILGDGYYGLLVPVEDPPALAEAIASLLHNIPLRDDFRGRAMKRARDFAVDSVVRRFEEVIDQVCCVR